MTPEQIEKIEAAAIDAKMCKSMGIYDIVASKKRYEDATDPDTVLDLIAEIQLQKQRDADTHKQFQQIKAKNKTLREALTKEVVKKHEYPACGDHPDMYGWVTTADGEFGAAHLTKDEALDFYLEALKGA